MNRRTFLNRSLLACASLSSCTRVPKTTLPAHIRLPEKWLVILHYAALSPSICNIQPWRIKIEAEDAVVVCVSKYNLPAIDPHNKYRLFNLACFFETLFMAAAGFGSLMRAEVLTEKDRPDDFIRIRLEPHKPRTIIDIRILETRATTRTPFATTPLSAEHIQTLQAQSPSNLLYFPRQSKEGQFLCDAIPLAESIKLKNREKLNELRSWVRWSPESYADRRDGISAADLGLGWRKGSWIDFLRGKTVSDAAFRERYLTKIREQVNHCAGFFVLSSWKSDSFAFSSFQSGTLYQHFCFKATESGVAHQPMNAILEDPVSRTQLQQELKLKFEPVMLVRAGYAPFSPPALKKPVQCFYADS